MGHFKLTREQASIRSKLELRQDALGTWQLYSTVHGTNVFRWFKISPETAAWYRTNFPNIKVTQVTQHD